MVTDSIIKHLLCDKSSLTDYKVGKEIDHKTVSRRLLLLARAEDHRIPDHYYRLGQDNSMKGLDSICSILTDGLYRIANEFLELRVTKITVKQRLFNEWQELIPYLSPLILQAAHLAQEKPIFSTKIADISDYMSQWILPNFRYSSLPSPWIPQLEAYLKGSGGLHDLHMHLNGSTEIDLLWQDCLSNPHKVCEEVQNACGEKFHEQLEQEGLADTTELEFMLQEAERIRVELIGWLLGDTSTAHPATTVSPPPSMSTPTHPLSMIFSSYTGTTNDYIRFETTMFVMLFVKLRRTRNEVYARKLHYYMLIFGLINRLSVQQIHQNGFEQFQKITLNNLRENCEIDYLPRFLQLHGNDHRNIQFLEGRFAPKKNIIENEKLISTIAKGWDKLIANLKRQGFITKDEDIKLRLIAHFIKKSNSSQGVNDMRHSQLRSELWSKAIVIGYMLNGRSYLRQSNLLVGIDAAASEFDTPPEVFAPMFRYLRRRGLKHFTYHVGEDFYHIISGLRAIYEAVEFCDLRSGDRIGHGSAMGVSASLWREVIGDKVLMPKGTYLDDLIFVRYLITLKRHRELMHLIPAIERKIESLHEEIYCQNTRYNISILEKSWKLRKYCPQHILSADKISAKRLTYYCEEEYVDCENEKYAKTSNEYKLLEEYNTKICVDRYREVIPIDTEEIFSSAQITELQLLLLEDLHEREIVIETLPTSNVRIGFHRDYSSYHLLNWIQWKREGHVIPPIVIGTDDAGIFATNIYNEYANIYTLLTSKGFCHTEAMKTIEQLEKSSQTYRFI